ncbi:S-layer homology domain-containing protein [Paenibacillus pasadenensis]|uniref:S-layer homology domain-containing protein n=1 Tax=Paenibacillus TaxID=44249 RepID=UPI0004270EFA|nr:MULTISPECIES: S-layer homology domain-containing protein [Paenibacillus]QGG54836.1 hypothetical protein GE073_04035 [Paenibacillus sp. B01]
MKPSSTSKAAALLLLTGMVAAACSGGNAEQPSPKPSAAASPSATEGPVGTPVPTASAAPASVVVTDIGDHKFREQIVKLLESGIATPSSGGLFEPSAPVTKGDFLRWMTAYDDKGLEDADLSKPPMYPDLEADSPDYGWIHGLVEAGRLGAEPGKPLQLDGPLQRGELARLWAWYQDRASIKESDRDRLSSEVVIMSREDRKEIPEPYIRAVAHYVSVADGKPYLRTFGDTSRLAAEALVSRSQAAYWIVENAGEESGGDGFSPPAPKVQVEVQGIEEAAPAAAPSDIAGHKREAAVAKLAGQVAGVLDGSGAFRPDEPILRFEFIRWMAAYDDKGVIPFRAPEPTYSDVKQQDEGYELVEGLTQAGIISGFPDGTMRLSEPLTREQLTVLWGWYQRYGLVVKPLAAEVSEVNLRNFEDRDKVGKIFLGGVQAYVSSNWDTPPYLDTFGADKKLEPQKPVTRAEAAYWITQNAEVEAED